MKNLYDKSFDFDSCGIGFVANIKGLSKLKLTR